MYGDELRWRRKSANMKQEDVASKAGVSQAAIAKYEANSLSPNIYVAIKIAQLFDTTCEEMCGMGKYMKEDNK